MRGLFNDFKAFAIQGNLLEIAVAFILGVAFAAVVKSFVDDIVMNVIAAIFGRPDFSGAHVLDRRRRDPLRQLPERRDHVPARRARPLLRRPRVQHVRAPRTAVRRDCPHCLSSIPLEAAVCASCTRDVAPQPAR